MDNIPASLTVTPPELIDHIASFISNPKDLLSLALTSSHFPDIVIPLHLQVCNLRCDLARRSVWTTLRRKPSFALRVRRLELIAENASFFRETMIPLPMSKLMDSQLETIPLQLSPDLAAACLIDLIDVVEMMPNLHHFGWRECRPYEPEYLDKLFDVLSNLPDVKSLDINQLRSRTIGLFDLGTVGLSLWDTSNLVCFKLRIVMIEEQIWSKITTMLIDRCPAMETLDLRVYGPHLNFSRLFPEARWPQLRALSLIGELSFFFRSISMEMQQMITNAFWGRHPRLESLTLMPSFICSAGRDPLYIPPTATMNLRDLALTYNGEIFFWIAPAAVRYVTYFRLHSMVLTPFMVETCLKILGDMTALRFFSLLFWNPERLADLVHVIRGVEILHWIVKPTFEFERHSVFTTLPYLSHIAGILPRWAPSVMPSPDAIFLIQAMSRGLSLRYVSMEFNEDADEIPLWVYVIRDQRGMYTGFRNVTVEMMSSKKGIGKQLMPVP